MTLLVGGIAIGAVYALVAIGLTLIFRATGVVNFAQGEMLMAGAYAYVLLSQSGQSPLIQILGPIALGAAIGLVFFFVTRILLGHAPEISIVIGTLAISILMQAAARLQFTDNPMRAVPWLFGDRDFALGGGSSISLNSFTVVAATLIIFATLYVTFTTTTYGKAMRAVAEDPRRAAITGIPVNRMLALSWSLGGSATISLNSFTVVAVTIVIFAALYLTFTTTTYGKAMRAVAEDPRTPRARCAPGASPSARCGRPGARPRGRCGSRR